MSWATSIPQSAVVDLVSDLNSQNGSQMHARSSKKSTMKQNSYLQIINELAQNINNPSTLPSVINSANNLLTDLCNFPSNIHNAEQIAEALFTNLTAAHNKLRFDHFFAETMSFNEFADTEYLHVDEFKDKWLASYTLTQTRH